MLTVSLLFEDYVTRGQVGSGFGRLIGSGLGAIGGGLGLGALGYHLSGGDFNNPGTAVATALPALAGVLGGALGGNVIGSRVGAKVISNPEAAADFGNKWHRYGYIEDETNKIEPRDFLTSYNRKQRQANALRRMGYDETAINSAINPGYDPNGIPNATPQSVALTEPTTKVINK